MENNAQKLPKSKNKIKIENNSNELHKSENKINISENKLNDINLKEKKKNKSKSKKINTNINNNTKQTIIEDENSNKELKDTLPPSPSIDTIIPKSPSTLPPPPFPSPPTPPPPPPDVINPSPSASIDTSSSSPLLNTINPKSSSTVIAASSTTTITINDDTSLPIPKRKINDDDDDHQRKKNKIEVETDNEISKLFTFICNLLEKYKIALKSFKESDVYKEILQKIKSKNFLDEGDDEEYDDKIINILKNINESAEILKIIKHLVKSKEYLNFIKYLREWELHVDSINNIFLSNENISKALTDIKSSKEREEEYFGVSRQNFNEYIKPIVNKLWEISTVL